jgi:hypothetical protein
MNDCTDFSDYEVSSGEDKLSFFIKIRSKKSGKNFAIHRQYLFIDKNGSETYKSIDSGILPVLISSIKKKGITEGFILNDNNVNSVENIKPENLRHLFSQKEINFTSTGDKLKFHWPIFEKLKETNFGSIIRATLTLHQVCASKCHFCSTINRNRKDAISLEEAKNFIKKLYYDQAEFNKLNFTKYNDEYKKTTGSDIRLKSLILSGGGQPNLWPHFEEFVEWLSELDLDLGLITNGFPDKINDNIYNKFKWIRLSITPEDASPFYPNRRFDQQYIPKNIIGSDVTFGLSYVYGTWTSDGIIQRISNIIDSWGLSYVRFLTDCNLGRSKQLFAHNSLAERLFKLGLVDEDGVSKGKIFHQLKYHGNQAEADDLWDEGKCFLQTYNVFWDTTGHEENGNSYCYPCDSVTVLTDEDNNKDSARGFDSSIWGTVKNDEVERLFIEEWKSFFDPRENCSACLFMKNNSTIKNFITNGKFPIQIIEKTPMHVNFP